MARSHKNPDLGSPNRRPRASGWRIPVVALIVPLVALGSVLMLLTLRAQADHARQAQVEFTELAGDAKTGDALRWRANAERGVSRKLAADQRALRALIDARLTRLSVVNADNDGNVARVAERFRVYEDALDDQFRLFALDDRGQAAAVGKWRLEPASAELERELAAVSAEESAEARETTRRANVAVALSLGLGALALVVVLWRYDHSRRRIAEDRAAPRRPAHVREQVRPAFLRQAAGA